MKIDVNPHIANAFVSWRTSLAGLIGFVALNAPQFIAYLQANQNIDLKTFWFGFSILILGLVARDGTVTSEQSGAKAATPAPVVLPAPSTMPVLFVILALLCLSMLTGCETSVAVKKSQQDATAAVNATKTEDVPFIAKFISDTWADHETRAATRVFNAALAENTVLAAVTPAIPSPGTPPAVATVKVVPEAQRAAAQAKHDQDLAQIEIGRQQIKQAVINRFEGNLAAAQALQQGQANYYKTTGATTSTLQAGLDGALAAFQQFAPVISAVAPAKKK